MNTQQNSLPEGDQGLTLDEFWTCVRDDSPESTAKAVAELKRVREATPLTEPFTHPSRKGVVRFDSAVHTAEDVAMMTPHVQMLVAQAASRIARGRVVIRQTAPFPGDSAEDRRALIAAQSGLRLVD